MCISFTVGAKKLPAIICFLIIVLTLGLSSQNGYGQAKASYVINMVFTSDAHYGISRAKFRSDTNVISHRVNAAMIGQINTIPYLMLPPDRGVNAGKVAGGVDYIVEGGDIANRMEIPIQTAADSWAQFETDYMHLLDLKDHNGHPAKLLVVPGNHDISNAIGYAKP